jgi:hypothetical protein
MYGVKCSTTMTCNIVSTPLSAVRAIINGFVIVVAVIVDGNI